MSRKMMSDLDNKTGYYGNSSELGNVSGKDKKKKENKGGSVLGCHLSINTACFVRASCLSGSFCQYFKHNLSCCFSYCIGCSFCNCPFNTEGWPSSPYFR